MNNKFKENILNILESIESLENRDILKESVKERLNQSLLLYYNNLNKNYEEILEEDSREVIKTILSHKGVFDGN